MADATGSKPTSWDPESRSQSGSGSENVERGFFADLLVFAWENKAWWITPAALILVLLLAMVWWAQGEQIAPFFYALF